MLQILKTLTITHIAKVVEQWAFSCPASACINWFDSLENRVAGCTGNVTLSFLSQKNTTVMHAYILTFARIRAAIA